MNAMKKKIVGSAILLGLSLSAGISIASVNDSSEVKAAESFSQEYIYGGGFNGWSLTNYTDKSSYYLVPASSTESVATFEGIFTSKAVASDVVVTLNVATFGSGTNPSKSTFSLYADAGCSTAVTAAQSGTLPTSSSYTDVVYTVSQADAATFIDDLAIKITKPGKQIRLKSISVAFSYTVASEKTIVPESITASVGGVSVANGGSYAFEGELGAKITASAKVTYLQGEAYRDGNSVAWTSSDESVAVVNNTGLITTKSKGLTTISVTTTDATDKNSNVSTSFTLDTSRGTYAKGSALENPILPSEAIAKYDSLKNTTVYFEGYITDTKTKTTSDTERIEVYYGSSNSLTFEKGTEDQYVLGTKVIVCGNFYCYNSKIYETNSDVKVWIKEVEPVDSIEVKTAASKSVYNVGDTFDPTGLVLTANYESRSAEVTDTSKMSFSPSLTTPLTESDTEITITYEGKTTVLPITIDSSVHTESIVIEKADGTEVGETLSIPLDEAGVELAAKVNPSDSVDAITWTSSDENLAEVADGLVLFGTSTGTVRITAESGGKSDYVDIVIEEPTDAKVTSIAIVQGSKVKTKYYAGETEVDTTGLTVKATFSSSAVSGWSAVEENYTNVTWVLDRENGLVKAIDKTDGSLYDSFSVDIFDSTAPVVFAYTGTTTVTSGISEGTDIASYIAPDANVWSAVTNKNTASNQVGLNKDGTIRLYADTTNGLGTSLTIVSKNSNVYVKSVELTLGSTAGNYRVLKGNSVATGEEITAVDGQFVINDSSFIIQNTDSSSQLRIKTISVSTMTADEYYSAAAKAFEDRYLLHPVVDGVVADIPYDTASNTNNCLSTSVGGKGYFDEAVAAYNALESNVKILIATADEFANARARMMAWAVANGQTITFSEADGSLQISSAQTINGLADRGSVSGVAVAAIASVGAIALGGLFLSRKKKETK
ncbi:MAG: Ig-like domain-containing protein [Candidatus Enteromonas sp.]|nr:Ig-like domain-containing protein [Candidatus Enteromonas sp.]